MTVDETRHHHLTCGVDVDGVTGRCKILHPAGRTDFLDLPPSQQQSTVGNDAEFARSRTATRP